MILGQLNVFFFWGALEDVFKYPIVAWDKVSLPVESGGLGMIHGMGPFEGTLSCNVCLLSI